MGPWLHRVRVARGSAEPVAHVRTLDSLAPWHDRPAIAVCELVVALLFVGAVLSVFARRAKVPYPALLALAGAALALLPNSPVVRLDPELALTLLRARGVIGDDVYHRIEEELDWAELNAAASLR